MSRKDIIWLTVVTVVAVTVLVVGVVTGKAILPFGRAGVPVAVASMAAPLALVAVERFLHR